MRTSELNPKLLAVHATLGIAMLGAFGFHFRDYFGALSPRLADLTVWFGYLATPNFLLLGGLLCGVYLSAAPTRAAALRLVDLGLFLLVIGHLLVTAGTGLHTDAGTYFFAEVVVTDAFGIALCATWWLRRVSAGRLALAGAAIVILQWAVVLLWRPETPLEGVFASTLFGIKPADDPTAGRLLSALVPYLGIAMVGMAAGLRLATRFGREETGQLSRWFTRAGALCLAVVIGAKLAWWLLRPVLSEHWPAASWWATAPMTFDPRQKIPASPAYILFYCGAGTLLLGLLLNRHVHSWLRMPIHLFAVIGRAAFAAYVVHVWLADFFPTLAGFESNLSPVQSLEYTAAALLAMVAVSYLWDRRGGNRWLTVGIHARASGKRGLSAALGHGLNRALLASLVALCLVGIAQAYQIVVDRSRWEPVLQKFEEQDRVSPPPRDAVLFLGSSSIARWDLAGYFPDLGQPVINRGISSSLLSDAVRNCDRIAIPYRPRGIVLYAGDNDIDAGVSPQRLVELLDRFEHKIHAVSPHTLIVVISIKPSVMRWKLIDRIRAANRQIRAYCQTHSNIRYLDIEPQMLGPDRTPRPELFTADGIHLSPAGYRIWTNALKPLLQ